MVKRKLKESDIIERWNRKGAEGFFNWLSDIQPHIINSNNRYEIFTPESWQDKTIKAMLKVEGSNWIHSLIVLIWPRRHSKSTLFALIVLWLFTSRNNYTIQCLGNSEEHTERVQFRTLKNIIRNTPKLSRLIPDRNILSYEIKNPAQKNIIQRSAVNLASSFGDKLNVLWLSDFHATPDVSIFNAYQAALLDSQGALCLIDSNVDSSDGHVHKLQQEAEEDDSIFCSHLQYADFQQYKKAAPAWIDRATAKRLQKTLLPAAFDRDILGKRSDSVNALFPVHIINQCKTPYKLPADIKTIANSRKYVVGGGLDRARSFSLSGDNTVWTTTLKVASPEHGEPEYYILNQQKIFNSSAALIKKAILKDHERYHLDNVCLEAYETTDINAYLSDQGISCELVNATPSQQMSSFSEIRRIASECRLHFPDDLKSLPSEMQTFVYSITKGNKVSFGHSANKFHDDYVYSLNWSVYATRDTVLNLYVMGNILCHNKTSRRALCFLMGGDMVPFCSQDCMAYHKLDGMYKEYKRNLLDSDLNISEFYNLKVKQTGAKIYQAA